MKTLFTRKADGSEGPTQRTRIAGYTLNGTYKALPQHLPYLEQVKLVGAGFFEAAMLSERVDLCTFKRSLTGLTGEQAERLLELLMLADNKPGDDAILGILQRLTSNEQ